MTSLGTLISKKGSAENFVCIPNMSGLDIANTFNKNKKHHHTPHRPSDNFHALYGPGIGEFQTALVLDKE
ncbi:hypothetical protein TSUD_334490 [Trifolium subterraneum]|uniref:Uncharacterized protein n=1 Tax=Trifolium subterraneum TaxID=3900 RepID=A0A2Z6LVB1_TRISU|nr:hypothetical protein TSUD_334490 [Trifolium subterraneum]